MERASRLTPIHKIHGRRGLPTMPGLPRVPGLSALAGLPAVAGG
jgi:hypothetical protein